MLINKEGEDRINQVLTAVSSSISIYMIGRGLGQNPLQSFVNAVSSRSMTFLEQSFLAGKIAQQIGTVRLKGMTQAQISEWIQNNQVELTEADRAVLAGLRDDTDRWLQGRQDQWKNRLNQSITVANKEWRSVLLTNKFTEGSAQTLARNEALQELVNDVQTDSVSFTTDMDRLIQTEMHNYFQQGQVAGIDGEEYVYKIPRMSACPHCMRLHVNPDGSPKLYKLKDVLGTSNFGRKAFSWDFTIGPVHPHCYCILYRASDRKPPKLSPAFVRARRETLKKAIQAEKKPGLSHRDNPEILFQDVKFEPGEPIPEHQLKMASLVRDIYGDEI